MKRATAAIRRHVDHSSRAWINQVARCAVTSHSDERRSGSDADNRDHHRADQDGSTAFGLIQNSRGLL
jgi:hypothetical protein